MMAQAAARPKLTFEEYVDICHQTDDRLELVRGELVKMPPPTWMHTKIAKFLERSLDTAIEQSGYAWEAFRETGQRTESDSSRLPDVTVVPTAEIEQFLNQTAILTIAAPLVIEIVSPSSATEDYTDKLREYQALGIQEYWVVDHEGLGAARYIGFPKFPTITIYELVEGNYVGKRFQADDLIQSPSFKDFNLTANQVFAAQK